MIHLFINALAASAGAGVTYLRNVLPHLERRKDSRTTVLVNTALINSAHFNSAMAGEFAEFSNISVVSASPSGGAMGRFLFEQTRMRDLVRSSGAQALLSTGNFALRHSPIPQILLSGNSLYLSSDFARDLRQRQEYLMWIDNAIKARLARRSVHWTDVTVAPSQAFADDLGLWAGKKVAHIPHGFDGEIFISDSTEPPASMQAKLRQAPDALRLLFVSHYNYYRNFETLIRAIPILRGRLPGKTVKLFLTCQLEANKNPGRYRADSAARLVRLPEVKDSVVELGAVPYHLLHHVYRACHIYVTPAYTETFAHPLVEAMSSGLPIVASDLPVHREVCEDAAVYFSTFSPEELSARILQIYGSADLAQTLSRRGIERAKAFSWRSHVDQLLDLAKSLT